MPKNLTKQFESALLANTLEKGKYPPSVLNMTTKELGDWIDWANKELSKYRKLHRKFKFRLQQELKKRNNPLRKAGALLKR